MVSAQSEKRLLWHPRRDNKFVVGGGTQITLYEWAPSFPEIKHVTSQHDLQFMKCFAWSPDPAFDDLVAVGLSTGKVDLLRLEATKHASRHGVLSSGPNVSLPVRNSRSCNALAFCTTDPNYLAVGLDKVRGDCSLVIWDIHSAYPVLSISPSRPSSTTNEVGPWVLRPQPQIPRADIGPRTDTRVLQQHAPTEVVSSLSFLPQSAYLLLAGISHRWLRLFDLRSPVPATTNVASKVQGIATDLFDPHRIGCFGDGVVTIWDARKFPQPLLTFTEKDASADGARVRNSTYTTIEFSTTRRGTLATLERDASSVRFWDLMRAQPHVVEGVLDGERSNRGGRMSWTNLPWAAGSGVNQSLVTPKDTEGHPHVHNVVLSNTRKTKTFPRSLASFALVPSPQSHPLTSNVMVVNKDGDLELYAVHDTPKQAIWSARGDFAIGAGQSLRIISGFNEDEPPPEPWDIQTSAPPPQRPAVDLSSRSRSRPPLEDSTSRSRGRSKPSHLAPPAPTFGRGDEDGFPALNDSLSALGLSNSMIRQSKERTYSPASLRNYSYRLSSHESRARYVEGSSSRHENGGSLRGPSRRSHERNDSRLRMQSLKSIMVIAEDDVSMIMRHRAVRGYGLGKPKDNVAITQNDLDVSSGMTQTLSDLWSWINHSTELLCRPTPRLHGYDFSHAGVLGIWEELQAHPIEQNIISPLVPAQKDLLDVSRDEKSGSRRSLSPADELYGNFQAALLALASRQGGGKSKWKPTIPTSKLAQRQVGLLLCGWSLKEEDLDNTIKRWEKDGKYSQAACWLVFTKQYSKAVELLMRSDDESHHMMSGTVAAMSPHSSGSSPKSHELRDHCERLIVRLHDPYFRALMTHLTLGDWSEVLEEEALPFRERIAIALQFLDDKSLTSYLRRTTDRSCTRGDIEAIVITGLTPSGMNILQSYVDRTGDVQTAAILSSYVCPLKFTDARAGRWTEAYRDLLDGFKLFHHRVAFDVERGQILHDAVQNEDLAPHEWVPHQILIRCNYCNKSISLPGSVVGGRKGRATACPHCERALPRCSICLMTLGVVQDAARDAELAHSHYKDTIDDAIVVCQTCRHGGHAAHILDWFFGEDGTRSQGHKSCAVADCDCHCADLS